MSDDDYGDYEEAGAADGADGADAGEAGDDPAGPAAEADETDAETEADAAEASEDSDGLDEGAAGSDDGSGEDAPAGAAPAPRARPERARPDPLLRQANLPRVVRVVPPDARVTDSRLHKTEAAYVIAMRAQQIAKHATCFTDGGAAHDPVVLAFKELLDRRCPFILRRGVGVAPDGSPIVEEWAVREMTLPPLTPPAPLGGAAAPARGPGKPPDPATPSTLRR